MQFKKWDVYDFWFGQYVQRSKQKLLYILLSLTRQPKNVKPFAHVLMEFHRPANIDMMTQPFKKTSVWNVKACQTQNIPKQGIREEEIPADS